MPEFHRPAALSNLLESMPSAKPEAKLLYSLSRASGPIESLAFSADRKFLATGSRDGAAKVWDVSGNQPAVRASLQVAGGVRSLAFAPNGRTLAAGSVAGLVSLFDLSSAEAKEFRTLRGSKGSIDAVAFSPDGRMVAGGGEDQIFRLWEAGTGFGSEPKSMLPGHTKPIQSLAFAPDGKSAATGAQDGTARVWALNRIRPGQQTSLPNPGDVCTLAYLPDGQTLATSGKDAAVWLWDLTAAKPTVRTRLAGHASGTRLVLITPDAETVVTIGAAGEVGNWSPRTGRLRKEWALPSGTATRFALTPDGRYLVRGFADGKVEMLRVADKRAAGTSHHG